MGKDRVASGGLDQAAQSNQTLPEYSSVVFTPAITHSDGSAEGSAILTRLPIIEKDFLTLTLLKGLADTSPRLVIKAQFDLVSGPLQLFNAHFAWVTAPSLQD